MQAKTIQQAPDPNLGPEQEAANRALVTNLQNQAELDTASLMARYGTRLALSGWAPSTAAGSGTPSIFGKAGV